MLLAKCRKLPERLQNRSVTYILPNIRWDGIPCPQLNHVTRDDLRRRHRECLSAPGDSPRRR